MIDPRQVIERYSVEEICAGAEEYFASIKNTGFHERKPLSAPEDASELLLEVGLLLRSLRLAPGMRVLDLGAGTAWLSRILNELGCQVTACDPSRTALEIGRRTNSKFPFVDPKRLDYEVFNGRTIDHPDGTFDRIVCFEAFHHMPNWEAVLGEIHRTLKVGGMAGFAEPGYGHSRSAMSQYEMAHFVVLENDIRLDAIVPAAERVGLRFLGWETDINKRQTLEAWKTAVDAPWWSPRRLRLGWKLFRQLKGTLRGRTIFFLAKGLVKLDSRQRHELAGLIELECEMRTVNQGERLQVNLRVTNLGEADWLHSTDGSLGMVCVGLHLCTEGNALINRDVARAPIGRTLASGESATVSLTLPELAPGRHRLEFDLVAEGVTWFASAEDRRHSTLSRKIEVK